MYAKRFSKGKARSSKRPSKRVPRKSGAARTSIVKIVKSVISRQAENKAWFDYGLNQSIATVAGTTPTAFKNLIPLPAQGAGVSNRIGNEIRVKSGYIRGHVNILPYDATLNPLPLPLFVKIWVCSCKNIQTTTLSSTGIGGNFFDIVNSSVGFQGNILDLDFTPNNMNWTIHGTKMLKLGQGYASATGPTAVNSYFDNSPMSVPFYFNLGKYMKTVKFDDNTTPTNKNMFIIFQAVPANGANAGGLITAEYHYSTRINYEDM